MTKKLYVSNESPKDLAKIITKEAASGNHVTLVFLNKKVPPEQIMKIISATVGKHDVELMIYHPEIKEYLENALVGSAIGVGCAGVAVVLALLRSASPIGWAQIVTTGLLGVIIGAIIGIGITPIASIKISKTWFGKTKMEFIPVD